MDCNALPQQITYVKDPECEMDQALYGEGSIVSQVYIGSSSFDVVKQKVWTVRRLGKTFGPIDKNGVASTIAKIHN